MENYICERENKNDTNLVYHNLLNYVTFLTDRGFTTTVSQETHSMSTEVTTNDSESIENDESEYEWEVSASGMTLRKDGMTYEIEHSGQILRFKEIRDEEEQGYEIRGSNYFTVGYFDPTDDDVPAEIASAFRILASEA